MEIARGKRFSLLALEGVTIVPEIVRNLKPSISYCIVDRDWNYQEVWSDYSVSKTGTPNGTRFFRRQRALEKLNEFEGVMQ